MQLWKCELELLPPATRKRDGVRGSPHHISSLRLLASLFYVTIMGCHFRSDGFYTKTASIAHTRGGK